jgi:amino acid transporter
VPRYWPSSWAWKSPILLLFGFTVLLRGGGPEGLSIAASFSPEAIASGAPGVAIMFAVASMFGFESTAIYSAEAKDPHRTVARATYLSVGIIAVFFSFITWMLVSFYGPSHVIDAAGAALESGDATSFVITPLVELFGPWAGVTAGVLLVTSLLAGIIAFHNGINRYLHSLALRGSLPAVLARTNKHRAPASAAWVQTTVAVLLVAPFAALGMDPVLTLFSWFSGLAVAALLVLYMLCSLAVVAYFRREGCPDSSGRPSSHRRSRRCCWRGSSTWWSATSPPSSEGALKQPSGCWLPSPCCSWPECWRKSEWRSAAAP